MQISGVIISMIVLLATAAAIIIYRTTFDNSPSKTPQANGSPNAHAPPSRKLIKGSQVGVIRAPTCVSSKTTLSNCEEQASKKGTGWANFKCNDRECDKGVCTTCDPVDAHSVDGPTINAWQNCLTDVLDPLSVAIVTGESPGRCPKYDSEWSLQIPGTSQEKWLGGRGFSDHSTCFLNEDGVPQCQKNLTSTSLQCASLCANNHYFNYDLAQYEDPVCICRGSYVNQNNKIQGSKQWSGFCTSTPQEKATSPTEYWVLKQQGDYCGPAPSLSSCTSTPGVDCNCCKSNICDRDCQCAKYPGPPSRSVEC